MNRARNELQDSLETRCKKRAARNALHRYYLGLIWMTKQLQYWVTNTKQNEQHVSYEVYVFSTASRCAGCKLNHIKDMGEYLSAQETPPADDYFSPCRSAASSRVHSVMSHDRDGRQCFMFRLASLCLKSRKCALSARTVCVDIREHHDERVHGEYC
jgi:hypothetical protein